MTLKDVENIIAWLNCQIEKARRGDLPMEAIAFYGDVLALVKNLPTIKADPVRHGSLLDAYDPRNSVCSECGAAFHRNVAKHFKGCPICLCRFDRKRTPTEVQLDGVDDVMLGGAENENI